MAAGKKTGGRQKGTLNKRSSALLTRLRQDYDLDPIEKLAETCSLSVPMTDSKGDPVCDENGNIIMVPYLKANELINALGKLADKTYPTLKAQEIDINADNLPTVVMDMRGVLEETKTRAARKKTPVKRTSRKQA